MTTTYKEYREEKDRFFQKHKHDFKTETSSMDEYGRYFKNYIFADGHVWSEVMGPEYVTEKVEIKKVNVSVEVKMFRTEYFSTESASKYYYEKF